MSIKMDRTGTCDVITHSEEHGWTDATAKEALAVLEPYISEIESRFGEDLTTERFLVTAYVAAQDPQCKTRKDFDRLCGLSEKGVHSPISYNLGCVPVSFGRNRNNKKAARYIYHKVRGRT